MQMVRMIDPQLYHFILLGQLCILYLLLSKRSLGENYHKLNTQLTYQVATKQLQMISSLQQVSEPIISEQLLSQVIQMEQPQSPSPINHPPEQAIELTDPSSQPYQYTIFINNCNGYIGSQLVETFRNDHIIQLNPNIIIGTLDPTDSTPPPSSVQIVEFHSRTHFNTAINNSDIIIFEIEDNRSQFQYIIQLIKYLPSDKNKTVICISNFQSWNSNEQQQITIKKRNGADDYLKSLENLCTDIESKNRQAKGYVVYKGVVYGAGEKVLFPFFKQSILSSAAGLSVVGKGDNVVPMIHVQDLCQIVQHISTNAPKQKHYIASDGISSTQYQILKAIADNLGQGVTNIKQIEDIPMHQVPKEFFLNLRTRKTELPIEWNCPGFISNIGNIIFEFNEARGIRTNKIFVGGMPVSGKTTIATILSKHYNLPLINIKQTVEYIKNHPSEFGENIKKILQETKLKMVEEEQKIFEEAKKKKKPKKGEPVEEFDPSKVIPRLSEQNLIKVFRARISQQDCKNKGYVLDSFPKTSHQANQLFKQAEDSLPNSGFYIESTEQEVKQRVKKLPPETSKDTHWTEEATLRRLGMHKTHIDGNKHILQFFKDNNIDSKKVPFNFNEPKPELVSFVERNGSMGLTQSQPIIEPEQLAQQQKQSPQNNKQNTNEEQELDIESLKENQRRILDQKSKPIRQYLIDNVIPQLTQGLIEICRENPQNPLDFLIQFLEGKQSLQIS